MKASPRHREAMVGSPGDGGGGGDDPGVDPLVEALLGAGLLAAASASFVLFEALDPLLEEAGRLEPLLEGAFFVAQVGGAGAGLWLLGRGISRGADLEPPSGRRERLVAASAILLAAVASSGVARWGDPLPEALLFGLFVVIPSVLVWAAIVVAFWSPGRDLARVALAAAGGYAAVGLATLATGIPGYVGPGAPFLLPFWPAYWLWLHECAFGVGLWACPPG